MPIQACILLAEEQRGPPRLSTDTPRNSHSAMPVPETRIQKKGVVRVTATTLVLPI